MGANSRKAMNQLGEEVKWQLVGGTHHDGGRTQSLRKRARVLWRSSGVHVTAVTVSGLR